MTDNKLDAVKYYQKLYHLDEQMEFTNEQIEHVKCMQGFTSEVCAPLEVRIDEANKEVSRLALLCQNRNEQITTLRDNKSTAEEILQMQFDKAIEQCKIWQEKADKLADALEYINLQIDNLNNREGFGKTLMIRPNEIMDIQRGQKKCFEAIADYRK